MKKRIPDKWRSGKGRKNADRPRYAQDEGPISDKQWAEVLKHAPRNLGLIRSSIIDDEAISSGRRPRSRAGK